MADKTVTQENAGVAINDVDLFRGVQGGVSIKFTFTQVKAWVKGWITKTDVGLTNVDNTSDVNKPVSTLQAAAIATIPQNSKSVAFTLALTDAGKHIFHPDADATARIWTIDANATVPFPIGTAITFVNGNGAGVLTIAITTDTMRLSPTGTTGSRTLANNGIATAIKIATTEWKISGSGLT